MAWNTLYRVVAPQYFSGLALRTLRLLLWPLEEGQELCWLFWRSDVSQFILKIRCFTIYFEDQMFHNKISVFSPWWWLLPSAASVVVRHLKAKNFSQYSLILKFTALACLQLYMSDTKICELNLGKHSTLKWERDSFLDRGLQIKFSQPVSKLNKVVQL